MSSSVPEKNIQRYVPTNSWGDRGSRFCLLGMTSYKTDSPAVAEKVEALLEGNTFRRSPTNCEQNCTVGGCILTIVQDTEEGRIVTGSCVAADYCLKTAFEASGNAPTSDEKRSLYRQIMDTTEGYSDKYSAGNFCPKLDCGLSAGFSIDGHRGTAGQCTNELATESPQLQINFDRIRL